MNSIVPANFDFLMNTVRADGMVSATALTKAYRNATVSDANPSGVSKECRHWLATQEAKDSIAYLEQVSGIPRSSLVIVEHGVGTWIHPDLAEILAQWISVEYRFAVVALIRQTKAKENTPPQQPSLSPSASNRAIAEDIRAITDTLFDNPRLAQFLIDQTIDQCFSQRSLPSNEVPIKGAAEIAESLGLPVNLKNRSALGKFVKSCGHEILKEERLCNGQMRTINCYRVTPEVEESVRSFFR